MVRFVKANRLFTAACAWVIVAAIAHTTAILNTANFPDDVVEAVEALDNVVVETGTPMTPTLLQVFVGVWIQVGGLLIALAVVSLAGAAAAHANSGVRRAISTANTAVLGSLAIVFLIVPIPQAFVVFLVSTFLFGTDAVLSFRNRRSAPDRS